MHSLMPLLDELFDRYERGGFSVAKYAVRPGRSSDEVRSRVLGATGFEATEDLVEWYGYFDGTAPLQHQLAPSFSAALSLEQACHEVAQGVECLREYSQSGQAVTMSCFPVFGWEKVTGDGNVMLDGPERGLLRVCAGYDDFHPIHAQTGHGDEAKALTLQGWIQRLVDAFDGGRIKAYTVDVGGTIYHNVAALNDDAETMEYPWR